MIRHFLLIVVVFVPQLRLASGQSENNKMAREIDRQMLARNGVLIDEKSILRFLDSLRLNPESQQKIEASITKLGAAKYAERFEASRILRDSGVSAVPLLEAALEQSKDVETRLRLSRLLNYFGTVATDSLVIASFRELQHLERTQSILPLIFQSLTDHPNYYVQRELTLVLSNTATTKDRGILLSKLDSETVACVVASVQALAKLAWTASKESPLPKESDLYRRMVGLLKHKSSTIRLAAARELALGGHRIGSETLVALLDDGDVQIRNRSIEVLKNIADEPPTFIPYDLAENRIKSLKPWQEWLDTLPQQYPARPRQLPSRLRNNIVGLLISGSANGVELFDLNGKMQRRFNHNTYDAQMLNDGRLVLAVRTPGKIVFIDRKGNELRAIPNLNSPTDVEALPNGNVLVLENGAGSVSEYDALGKKVWKIDGLQNPFDADRLPNGNTLVADSGNSRLVEFSPDGKIVWTLKDIGFANNVTRLRDGNTAYTTYTSGTVVIASPSGETVRTIAVPNSVLYAVQEVGEDLVFGDGQGRKIYWYDQLGKQRRVVDVPRGFTDVFFVRQ